jgi:hypothetical protein
MSAPGPIAIIQNVRVRSAIGGEADFGYGREGARPVIGNGGRPARIRAVIPITSGRIAAGRREPAVSATSLTDNAGYQRAEPISHRLSPREIVNARSSVTTIRTISIVGFDKAKILAALYNSARPHGLGFLQYKPEPMTDDEARALLAENNSFDYINGRPMKITIGGDELDVHIYDDYNGKGAAAAAIEKICARG